MIKWKWEFKNHEWRKRKRKETAFSQRVKVNHRWKKSLLTNFFSISFSIVSFSVVSFSNNPSLVCASAWASLSGTDREIVSWARERKCIFFVYLSLSPSILSCNDSPSLWKKNTFYRSNKSWLFRHNNRMRENDTQEEKDMSTKMIPGIRSEVTQLRLIFLIRLEKRRVRREVTDDDTSITCHSLISFFFSCSLLPSTVDSDRQSSLSWRRKWLWLPLLLQLLNYCRREVVSCSLSNQHLAFFERLPRTSLVPTHLILDLF